YRASRWTSAATTSRTWPRPARRCVRRPPSTPHWPRCKATARRPVAPEARPSAGLRPSSPPPPAAMTDHTPDILLFSYGTLQLESVQLASFGRRLDGSPDAIRGYVQTMLEITDPEVLATSGERFHPIVSPSDNLDDAVQG